VAYHIRRFRPGARPYRAHLGRHPPGSYLIFRAWPAWCWGARSRNTIFEAPSSRFVELRDRSARGRSPDQGSPPPGWIIRRHVEVQRANCNRFSRGASSAAPQRTCLGITPPAWAAGGPVSKPGTPDVPLPGTTIHEIRQLLSELVAARTLRRSSSRPLEAASIRRDAPSRATVRRRPSRPDEVRGSGERAGAQAAAQRHERQRAARTGPARDAKPEVE
jgi:hypothetical protein